MKTNTKAQSNAQYSITTIVLCIIKIRIKFIIIIFFIEVPLEDSPEEITKRLWQFLSALTPSTNYSILLSKILSHSCRYCILCPLQLEPLFSNNVRTLRLKVGLWPNQIKIDLWKVFMENVTYFWKHKTIFGKERPRKP